MSRSQNRQGSYTSQPGGFNSQDDLGSNSGSRRGSNSPSTRHAFTAGQQLPNQHPSGSTGHSTSLNPSVVALSPSPSQQPGGQGGQAPAGSSSSFLASLPNPGQGWPPNLLSGHNQQSGAQTRRDAPGPMRQSRQQASLHGPSRLGKVVVKIEDSSDDDSDEPEIISESTISSYASGRGRTAGDRSSNAGNKHGPSQYQKAKQAMGKEILKLGIHYMAEHMIRTMGPVFFPFADEEELLGMFFNTAKNWIKRGIKNQWISLEQIHQFSRRNHGDRDGPGGGPGFGGRGGRRGAQGGAGGGSMIVA